MSQRGFILQPTYRIERGRPVIHLYGIAECGRPFLVLDDRQIPRFYIRRSDADLARLQGAERILPSGRRSMQGEPMVRIELSRPSDTPPLRDRLIRAGIACFEADVRFAMRYLIERGLRGAIRIEGEAEEGAQGRLVFRNPELAPCDWTPQLRVLSLDIETDPEAAQLLSIAIHGCGASEVLLLTPQGYSCPAGAQPFAEEGDLLRAFCSRVRELDPDVLTGWNVIDFDLHVLQRIGKKKNLELELGRGGEALKLRRSRSPWNTYDANAAGRVVADGIAMLRGSFLTMEEYSLDFVANRVLGKRKVMHGHDRAQEILDSFRNQRERFVEYNLTDARLASEILERLGLIELSVQRSTLTGLPIDRVAGSIAAFDSLYLSELHKRSIVAPSVGAEGTDREAAPDLGGHVLEPEVGLYRDVLVFDFKSLYPSLIRTFQIDPLNLAEQPSEREEWLYAPNGAAFRRRPGILPQMLDRLFPRREAARASGDKTAAYAIKILMNSFYGVLGTPACRFYRPRLAGAITSFGREILLWSKARLESYGCRVLYGDTDSLFALTGSATEEQGSAAGRSLAQRLNRDLGRHIAEKWGCESRLELEFEKHYLQLHLPSMRGGRGGARKRYAGLVEEDGQRRLVFTGMEAVRRDWTELAKGVQRELYRRLFDEEELEAYLEQTVQDLRAGRMDDLLVYRKALRKGLDKYVRTTPPHVVAARKMSRPPGRVIHYLMTTSGPEAESERANPIDYEHYVQKQLRPVAEPLLDLQGGSFDAAIGAERQLRLF